MINKTLAASGTFFLFRLAGGIPVSRSTDVGIPVSSSDRLHDSLHDEKARSN